jgi:hypothetical protein
MIAAVQPKQSEYLHRPKKTPRTTTRKNDISLTLTLRFTKFNVHLSLTSDVYLNVLSTCYIVTYVIYVGIRWSNLRLNARNLGNMGLSGKLEP